MAPQRRPLVTDWAIGREARFYHAPPGQRNMLWRYSRALLFPQSVRNVIALPGEFLFSWGSGLVGLMHGRTANCVRAVPDAGGWTARESI